VTHVVRIARALSLGSHALLIGVGGSGKRSLARLAAAVCSMETVGIRVSSTYSEADFSLDLRRFLLKVRSFFVSFTYPH